MSTGDLTSRVNLSELLVAGLYPDKLIGEQWEDLNGPLVTSKTPIVTTLFSQSGARQRVKVISTEQRKGFGSLLTTVRGYPGQWIGTCPRDLRIKPTNDEGRTLRLRLA
ncbi:hypothetical protein WN48_02392 [Eufriesea mexicana]|nr:hypothetical protein WN48_02392 [Eufriesea mexicana]